MLPQVHPSADSIPGLLNVISVRPAVNSQSHEALCMRCTSHKRLAAGRGRARQNAIGHATTGIGIRIRVYDVIKRPTMSWLDAARTRLPKAIGLNDYDYYLRCVSSTRYYPTAQR